MSEPDQVLICDVHEHIEDSNLVLRSQKKKLLTRGRKVI